MNVAAASSAAESARPPAVQVLVARTAMVVQHRDEIAAGTPFDSMGHAEDMTVGELCIREVIVVRPDETVVDAARVMREHHVGDVVVVREEAGRRKPAGILTDRDLVIEVLAQAPDKATVLSVEDVATMDRVATLEEWESAERALDTMLRHGVRRVPVVDGEGTLIGILAQDDLVEFLAGQMSRLARLPGHQATREEQRRP